MEKVFFRCEICGNLVGLVEDGGVPMVCCGQPMTKLVANSRDAAVEKHVPFLTRDGKNLTVQVGETAHPMTPEHYIQWILIMQGNKTQRVELSPEDAPKAEFVLDCADTPFIVYAYCNLHGLWKAEG